MSGVFSSPKKPKFVAPPKTEQTTTVTEDATEAGRRKRKHLVASQTKTKFAGMQNALLSGLKKRLGA